MLGQQILEEAPGVLMLKTNEQSWNRTGKVRTDNANYDSVSLSPYLIQCDLNTKLAIFKETLQNIFGDLETK